MLHKISEAIQCYKSDTNQIPENLTQLITNPDIYNWLGPYMKNKDINDPWGEKYNYYSDSKSEVFLIYTLGSDKAVGGINHAKDLHISNLNNN